MYTYEYRPTLYLRLLSLLTNFGSCFISNFFFISVKETIACLPNVPHNYLLTPWSRILLEKLTGSQLVKKFPYFMEPEGSLPHSQVPCSYPV